MVYIKININPIIDMSYIINPIIGSQFLIISRYMCVYHTHT